MFSKIIPYRLTQAFEYDIDSLGLCLPGHREPASHEVSAAGFIAPLRSGPLVEEVTLNGRTALLLAFKVTERNLPGAVVREELKKRVDEIEAEQLRKVYGKERNQLKDETVQALLPRAFFKHRVTRALIMVDDGLVLVDATTEKVAEALLSTLREAMGSLPIRPLSMKLAPSASMTDWLKAKQAPEGFHLLDECELRDTQEGGGIVRCKRQELDGEELEQHLGAGKIATSLALGWQDKLSFVIGDDLRIKRVDMDDELIESAIENGRDDADESADLRATLVLFFGLVVEFLPALFTALGGEDVPQSLCGSGELARQDDRNRTGDEEDPLYAPAVEFVRETRRASVSAMQRNLKIGYNHACRMLERMELEGVVTAMSSNGSREVIV